jgi:hypothetical protein
MVVDQIVLDHNKMQRFPSTDTKGLDQTLGLNIYLVPIKLSTLIFSPFKKTVYLVLKIFPVNTFGP